MALDPVSTALNLGGKILDKLVGDKDLKVKLKADLAQAALDGELKELDAAVSVIVAEAQGNWLQKSWRPMTMIWFSVLLGLYWFGFAPEYLIDNPATVDQLFDLLKIGIGGYIVGRSAEKVAVSFKK